MGSLFRFFSRYFSTAIRTTQCLLTWLVIAQLALQSFPSLRFLHRNFLSQVTHRCLNSYYRALRNETVTSCAWQERQILRDAPAEGMTYYPLKLYKMRWAIEANYYEQNYKKFNGLSSGLV
jgi:hypothetical protein